MISWGLPKILDDYICFHAIGRIDHYCRLGGQNIPAQLTTLRVASRIERSPSEDGASDSASGGTGGDRYHYTPIPPLLSVMLTLLGVPVMCLGWRSGPATALVMGWAMCVIGGAGLLMIAIESL
jgi:hypothetical protein